MPVPDFSFFRVDSSDLLYIRLITDRILVSDTEVTRMEITKGSEEKTFKEQSSDAVTSSFISTQSKGSKTININFDCLEPKQHDGTEAVYPDTKKDLPTPQLVESPGEKQSERAFHFPDTEMLAKPDRNLVLASDPGSSKSRTRKNIPQKFNASKKRVGSKAGAHQGSVNVVPDTHPYHASLPEPLTLLLQGHPLIIGNKIVQLTVKDLNDLLHQRQQLPQNQQYTTASGNSTAPQLEQHAAESTYPHACTRPPPQDEPLDLTASCTRTPQPPRQTETPDPSTPFKNLKISFPGNGVQETEVDPSQDRPALTPGPEGQMGLSAAQLKPHQPLAVAEYQSVSGCIPNFESLDMTDGDGCLKTDKTKEILRKKIQAKGSQF